MTDSCCRECESTHEGRENVDSEDAPSDLESGEATGGSYFVKECGEMETEQNGCERV